MPNIPDARKRILDAAAKIFSEKSFDGSRISDISNTANVPSSLIYYHFKSKEDILEVMIENCLEEYTKLLQTSTQDKDDYEPRNIADRLESRYFEFAKKNIELIRILLFESLKKNTDIPPIFKFVDGLAGNDDTIKADNSFNLDERRVAEFFTNLLPICTFLCFQKQWCDYFSISEKDLSSLFASLISETHGAYHKNCVRSEHSDRQNNSD